MQSFEAKLCVVRVEQKMGEPEHREIRTDKVITALYGVIKYLEFIQSGLGRHWDILPHAGSDTR